MQVWERRIRLLPGWKRIFRLAVGCWPGSDGHHPSSPSAATRATPISSGGWGCNREREEVLRGAEAAQRLQSRRRLRDRWMARDADRGNGSSGAASLRCDYEHGSLACYLGVSDGADNRVGL